MRLVKYMGRTIASVTNDNEREPCVYPGHLIAQTPFFLGW